MALLSNLAFVVVQFNLCNVKFSSRVQFGCCVSNFALSLYNLALVPNFCTSVLCGSFVQFGYRDFAFGPCVQPYVKFSSYVHLDTCVHFDFMPHLALAFTLAVMFLI